MDSEITLNNGLTDIYAALPGQDARVLADLVAGQKKPVLHICLDENRASLIQEAAHFFAPDLDVVYFPPWDCLPYDRVSPKPDIISAQIAALSTLAESPAAPRLIVTTVNALLQRVPDPKNFTANQLTISQGGKLKLDVLQFHLIENGYTRVDTVREAGEYAVRGGIIDIFPSGFEEPVRIDLFGDEVEHIRHFDPSHQLTTETLEKFTLKAAAQVSFNSNSIEHFRTKYREYFGVPKEDSLYEAVKEGRRYAGMEHWLPLFYPNMTTLFDVLPGAVLSFDPQLVEANAARWAQISDFYEARKASSKIKGEQSYNPLPPEVLYVPVTEFEKRVHDRQKIQLHLFRGPDEKVQDAGAKPGPSFADARNDPNQNIYEVLKSEIKKRQNDHHRVLLAAYTKGSRDRLANVLTEGHDVKNLAKVDDWSAAQKLDLKLIGLAVLGLDNGFSSDDLTIITEQDILGDRLARPQRKRRQAQNYLSEINALHAGDIVVHEDHGIGKFIGLETIEVSGAPHDCLQITYDGGDKLYVPVENIEVLSRYGSADSVAQLDKLGSSNWQARKARVKKRLKDMAEELLKIAAARELKKSDIIHKPEGAYEEFCARFPYAETDDQLKSIEDVLNDFESGRAMDRLICGDVGFGKTEVALRAAFVAAMAGLQVAVVTPTTLLARQHFQNFKTRFSGLPLRVEQLSRLVNAKQSTQIKKELGEGRVDIVIGTHALLGKEINFKNLGLVIVDEEQHFGVKQKERLKQLRENVHVLTLTATPIPRTLQMALSGVRELSLITTPPIDRLAINTFILPFDSVVIREALMREHYRGGQSFYVCPRIEDIAHLEEQLKEIVPEIKFISAHGRMPPTELEKRMQAFCDGKYEILLATNIIESGLDIPRANTMIMHRADMFGLAQLYQLRGRIGRAKLRGYAYLTYDKVLTKNAEQRLKVLETLDSLGAGFQLASHDMDIRGAGNLLGEEQSGHIREVGVELFQQMLDDAIAEARAGIGNDNLAPKEAWSPQINLGMPVLIPEDYIHDLHVRLGLYRRLADLQNQPEVEAFAAELIDRFGPLPPEVENLLNIVSIKQVCRLAQVAKIDAGPKGAVVSFHQDRFGKVDQLMHYVMQHPGTIKLRPDQKLVYVSDWHSEKTRIKGVQNLIQKLASIAA